MAQTSSQSTTKVICFMYLFPSSFDYPKFFDHLTPKSSLVIWMFTTACDHLIFKGKAGELANHFFIQNILKLLVKLPTRILDYSNILVKVVRKKDSLIRRGNVFDTPVLLTG